MGPTQGIPVGLLNVRLQDISILALVLVFATTERRLRTNNKALILVVPLIGLAVYSTILLPFQDFSVTSSLVDLIELSSYIALFVIITHYLILFTRDDIEKTLYLLFLISLWGSINALFHSILLGGRVVGVVYVFGASSIIYAFGLYYTLSRLIEQGNYVYALGTVVILVRVLVSNTRTLWLLLPLPMLVILLRNGHFKWRGNIKKLFGYTTATASLVALSIFINPSTIGRFLSIIQGSQGLFIRPIRWYSGLQLLKEYPYGVGLGNFPTGIKHAVKLDLLTYPDWFSQTVSPSLIQHQKTIFTTGETIVHSDIFRFTAELGLIGTILIISFWTVVLRMIINQDNQGLLPVAGTILYSCLYTIVNPGLLTGNITITLILISIYATYSDVSKLG